MRNITVPGNPVASGWRCNQFQTAAHQAPEVHIQQNRGGATEVCTALCLNTVCIGHVYQNGTTTETFDVPNSN
jgi:hypothetical protein